MTSCRLLSAASLLLALGACVGYLLGTNANALQTPGPATDVQVAAPAFARAPSRSAEDSHLGHRDPGSLHEPQAIDQTPVLVIDVHANGQRKSSGAKINDHWVGDFATWYSDGHPEVAATYDGDGELDGSVRTWSMSPGGYALSQYSYSHGRFHGPFAEYFEDGRPKRDGVYDHGVRTGTWHIWHQPSGRLWATIPYTDGRENGVVEYRYDNAPNSLESQGTYRNGMRIGLYRSWSKAGDLVEDSWYTDDRADLSALGQSAVTDSELTPDAIIDTR